MLRMNKKIAALLVSLLLITSIVFMLATATANTPTSTLNNYNGVAPKYVFMFIGDGMSYPQINSTEIFSGKNTFKDSKTPALRRLSFSNFPVAGACTTFDATSFCPDSASTATSYSTGYKTLSNVINMDVDKKVKYKTITEMIKEMGYKVGIVSSVSIDHATPAAYYAHQPSRGNYYEIAMEMANSTFDFFGGGGLISPKGKNNDQPDVVETAKKNGFKVVNTKEEILALNKDSGRVIAMNPVVDKDKALPYEIDRTDASLSLADFTRKAIEVLDNKNGFFLMVEGGKIDWACHANDAATAVNDTLAFEKAVNEAIFFYHKHPKETLIVVTGDHETGGLSIGFAATGYSTFYEKLNYQKKSYLEFDKFVADYKAKTNADQAKLEDILPEIKASFGLITSTDADAATRKDMVLTDYEVQLLKNAFKQTMIPSGNRKYTDGEVVLYGSYEPITVTLTHILNNKSGIGWSSYSHTGSPVPVFAMGLGQELFNGYYDNTDVFKKLKSILKIK
ncbi:MAG: alkaline phosphatase [Clostridia bacterium]|nr:alkaline phosphatase [Clostridia bacterium]